MSDGRFDKIKFSDGEKFDIQLGQAKRAEERLAVLLQDAKLELKTETWLWEQTGNICIEYQRGSKPSGIASTDADFWVHELRREDDTLAWVIIPIDRLKVLCRDALKRGRGAKGGDGGLSLVVKLRLSELWK